MQIFGESFELERKAEGGHMADEYILKACMNGIKAGHQSPTTRGADVIDVELIEDHTTVGQCVDVGGGNMIGAVEADIVPALGGTRPQGSQSNLMRNRLIQIQTPYQIVSHNVPEQYVLDKHLIDRNRGLFSSVISLLMPLSEDHFISAGELRVKCRGTIAAEFWENDVENVFTDTSQKDRMVRVLEVQESQWPALCRKASASFEIPETTYGKISIDMTTDLVDKDGDLDFRITMSMVEMDH
eukprot:snap_masked-scaffold49_size462716-processed-gene-0.3 protein:Tk03610 transcript:snap_masked-scaffold49_size462716-processed-gene-0.3-mRNA-1 annotation:"elongation factor g"